MQRSGRKVQRSGQKVQRSGPSAQVGKGCSNNIQLQPPPPPTRTNTARCSNHCNLCKGTRTPYKPLLTHWFWGSYKIQIELVHNRKSVYSGIVWGGKVVVELTATQKDFCHWQAASSQRPSFEVQLMIGFQRALSRWSHTPLSSHPLWYMLLKGFLQHLYHFRPDPGCSTSVVNKAESRVIVCQQQIILTSMYVLVYIYVQISMYWSHCGTWHAYIICRFDFCLISLMDLHTMCHHLMSAVHLKILDEWQNRHNELNLQNCSFPESLLLHVYITIYIVYCSICCQWSCAITGWLWCMQAWLLLQEGKSVHLLHTSADCGLHVQERSAWHIYLPATL